MPRPFPGAASAARAPPPPPPAPATSPRPANRADDPPPGPRLRHVRRHRLALPGTPYRNGGSDPSGFDCSGFVQWVFARHGLALPREVRDQCQAGDDIDRDEVKPGDLVFFETVSRGASHVGIALGGDQFVHAPSSRAWSGSSATTSRYWSSRWVGARRVLAALRRDSSRRRPD